MTAEIAILNKEAVALAADSAMTMIIPRSGQKVFTSANKLFTLSKYHPVGVMIYGNPIFMGIPWETLIKVYRKKLGTKSFSTIEEYGEDFLSFLTTKEIFSEETQKMYVKTTLYSYLNFMKRRIEERVQKELENKDKLDEKDIRSLLREVIEEQYNVWKNGETSESISNEKEFHNKVVNKYKEIMDLMMKEILEELPFGKDEKKKIRDILSLLFYKFPKNIEHSGMTGVVIAGFGEEEIFPSLVSYKIEGVLEGSLKYKSEARAKVDLNTSAVIIPFAQKDMVHLFMEGVYRDYLVVEKNYLSKLLQEFLSEIEKRSGYDVKNMQEVVNSVVEDFEKKLSEYRKNKYTSPIMEVVSLLPKSELAMMAETLVNLISLKRKWSTEQETVGGPIDVALISKGDGFIWIKRKHYFNPELNPYFFEKYFMEVRE